MELTHEEKMALLGGLSLLKDELITISRYGTDKQQMEKTQDAIDKVSALFEKISKADLVRVETSSAKDEAFCVSKE